MPMLYIVQSTNNGDYVDVIELASKGYVDAVAGGGGGGQPTIISSTDSNIIINQSSYNASLTLNSSIVNSSISISSTSSKTLIDGNIVIPFAFDTANDIYEFNAGGSYAADFTGHAVFNNRTPFYDTELVNKSYVDNTHSNYYSHNILLQDTTTSLECDVRIINGTNTVPTYQQLYNFLSSNGFNEQEYTFVATGTVTNSTSGETHSIYGIYAMSGGMQIMCVGDDFVDYPATNLANDKVVHLGGN